MAADSPATPSTTGDHAKSTIVGSLRHTPIEFWCSKGRPNHVIAVGTVKTPEATVTVSEPQLHETHTMGPVTHDTPLVIFSKINQAGKTVTITVKGNTSGSAFSVTGTIPDDVQGPADGSAERHRHSPCPADEADAGQAHSDEARPEADRPEGADGPRRVAELLDVG